MRGMLIKSRRTLAALAGVLCVLGMASLVVVMSHDDGSPLRGAPVQQVAAAVPAPVVALARSFGCANVTQDAPAGASCELDGHEVSVVTFEDWFTARGALALMQQGHGPTVSVAVGDTWIVGAVTRDPGVARDVAETVASRTGADVAQVHAP